MNEEEIFLTALEADTPALRSEYLDRACGSDSQLRASVESLLRAHEGAGTFLESPPFKIPPARDTLRLDGAGVSTIRDDSGLSQVTSARFPPQIPGYEFLDELGRGGMGVVYRARQTEADRLVALKILLDEVGGDASHQKRFRAEAEAIARLQHSGIVQIFEVGEIAGRPFFSLEYCTGGSLDRYLSQSPLPPRDAARLLRELTHAIQAAHDAGVVHRDLKPGNVLLQMTDRSQNHPTDIPDAATIVETLKSATPKIADFGLAKRLDDATRTKTGVVMGTPSYLAPEQAREKGEASTRTDLYALGAILYECLTGKPPFKAASNLETVLLVLEQEVVPPRQLQPGVPRDLETICLKCLQKDPAARYDTAGDLANDLQRFLEDRPIQARPIGPAARLLRWARRNQAVAVLLTTLIVVLTVGMIATTSLAILANRNATEALEAKDESEQAATGERRARKREAAQRRRAETLHYAGRLELTMQRWKSGDVEAAFKTLEKTDERYRGWEYHYIDYLFRRTGQATFLEPYPGASLSAGVVAVSRDGRLLATVRGNLLEAKGDAATIDVWEIRTGKKVTMLSRHDDDIACVAFSPDGKRLVSGSRDSTAKVWNLRTSRCVSTLKGHTGIINSVAFDSTGGVVATGSADRTIAIWNIKTGKRVRVIEGHSQAIACIAFSPDGKQIASAAGRPRFSIRMRKDGRRAIAFHVTRGSARGEVKVWDVETGKERLNLANVGKAIAAVAYNSDGTRLVTAGADGQAVVWDTGSGRRMRLLKANGDSLTGACFSADGKRIIGTGRNGSLTIWDAESGDRIFTLNRHAKAIQSLAVHPSVDVVVTGADDGSIKFWDVSRPQRPRDIQTTKGMFGIAAMSPDGRRIVFADRRGVIKQGVRPLRILDADTGRLLKEFDAHEGDITCIAFSPDGGKIISGGWDKTVRIFDSATGKLIDTLRGHTEAVQAVAISRDGSQIVSGGWDGTVRNWNASNGKHVRTMRGPDAVVSSVAFSPDGKRIASTYQRSQHGGKAGDGHLIVWNSVTGKEVYSKTGDRVALLSVAFDRSGKRIVTGVKDGLIRMLEAESGKELARLSQTSAVNTVLFSRDGRRILTGTADGATTLWDVETGIRVFDLPKVSDPIANLVFSKDGQRLLIGTRGRTIGIRDAFPRNNRLPWSRRFSFIAPSVGVSAD